MTLGAGLLAKPRPARADRPWAEAGQRASIIETRALPAKSEPWRAVAAGEDGRLIGLAATGDTTHLQSLDQQGHVTSFDPGIVAPDILTVDGDGGLWCVNQGKPGNGISLHLIDRATPRVRGSWPLPAALLRPASHLSAMAVHGPLIYLADDGVPALIVFDRRNNAGRRLLENNPSLRGRRATVIGGVTQMRDGHVLERDVAMLALSPDGTWLFYQPPCGPLYRIATELLTDRSVGPVEQLDGSAEWRDTPTLSGLVMTPRGTLLMVDVAVGRLLSFSAARDPLRLLADPRLAGAGAPSRDTDGTVLVPIAAGPAVLKISCPGT
ncbi:major royal jelly family protein [Acidomonas methanolica]|uniref:major royal jelly family protein n=1 Tax=Acidomonas methanolica TaxID=437 RepID=UPI00211A39DF|nr:hypothetical protein [Acidomonas methanolica]